MVLGTLASILALVGVGTGINFLSNMLRDATVFAKWRLTKNVFAIPRARSALQRILDVPKDEVVGMDTSGIVDLIMEFLDASVAYMWYVDEAMANQLWLQMIQQSIAYAMYPTHAGSLGTIANTYSGGMYMSPMQIADIGRNVDSVDTGLASFLTAQTGQNLPSASFALYNGMQQRLEIDLREIARSIDVLLDEWNNAMLWYIRRYLDFTHDYLEEALQLKLKGADRAYSSLEDVAETVLTRVVELTDALEAVRQWYDDGLVSEDELKEFSIRVKAEALASDADYDEIKNQMISQVDTIDENWDNYINEALEQVKWAEAELCYIARLALQEVFNYASQLIDELAYIAREILEGLASYREVTLCVDYTKTLFADEQVLDPVTGLPAEVLGLQLNTVPHVFSEDATVTFESGEATVEPEFIELAVIFKPETPMGEDFAPHQAVIFSPG